MVPLIGRMAAAIAFAGVLSAGAPQSSSSATSFDQPDAAYLAAGIDPRRIEDRLDRRPGATTAERGRVRALELRGGYDAAGVPVFFIAWGALPREFPSAERRRVFLFPRQGSGGDPRQDPVFDTTLGLHPVGLWSAAVVRYTRLPLATPEGRAMLDEIRARNGTDLDGTPLLKHPSEIERLGKRGFVQIEEGSGWKVWPLWVDPRRERIPADAYLEVPVRPDGTAVDQEVEQEFACLQRTGEFLHPPMPRLPPFVQPLPIPPEVTVAGAVDLRLQEIDHRFHPDLAPSRVWSYGGSVAGPTLRVRREEPVVVRCTNALPAAGNSGFGHPWTSCRIDAGSLAGFGFPGDLCKPGEARNHPLRIPGDGPSTGWYSDAPMGFAAQNVAKGLAGVIVASDPFDSGNENDPDSRASRLPSGACDVPLLLADREFDARLGHAPAWDPFERHGVPGSVDTVNGAVQPVLQVARRKYRFRLLNAGPSRNYDLSWTNGRPFILLGDEAGFLEAPREIESVFVAVGQRRDVVVDFSAVPLGSEMFLESARRRILKIVVDRDAPDPSRVPEKLPPSRPVPPDLPVRTFVIENPRGGWTVNGQAFDLARPHARLKRGAVEIWVVRHQGDDRRRPLFLRTGPFRILSRNGVPVRPGRSIDLLPGDELRLLVAVGDAIGRYVLPGADRVDEDQGLAIRWDVEP